MLIWSKRRSRRKFNSYTEQSLCSMSSLINPSHMFMHARKFYSPRALFIYLFSFFFIDFYASAHIRFLCVYRNQAITQFCIYMRVNLFHLNRLAILRGFCAKTVPLSYANIVNKRTLTDSRHFFSLAIRIEGKNKAPLETSFSRFNHEVYRHNIALALLHGNAPVRYYHLTRAMHTHTHRDTQTHYQRVHQL